MQESFSRGFGLPAFVKIIAFYIVGEAIGATFFMEFSIQLFDSFVFQRCNSLVNSFFFKKKYIIGGIRLLKIIRGVRDK